MGDTLKGSDAYEQEKPYLSLAAAIAVNMRTLSVSTVKYYLAHKHKIKYALERGFIPPAPDEVEKFELLNYLGNITVPDDYVQANWLTKFRSKYQGEFVEYSRLVFDVPQAEQNTLHPGDELMVHTVRTTSSVTIAEIFHYLRQQNASFVGAYGASLVWLQLRDKLEKGYWYASYVDKSGLPIIAGNRHPLPGIDVHNLQSLYPLCSFNTAILEGERRADHRFLLFTKLKK